MLYMYTSQYLYIKYLRIKGIGVSGQKKSYKCYFIFI